MNEHDCPFTGVRLPEKESDGIIYGLDKRIGLVEQEMSAVKVSLQNITHQLGDLSNTMKNMVSSSRTNWTTLATWASVLLAFVIYHSSLIMEPVNKIIDRHEQDINSLVIRNAAQAEAIKFLEWEIYGLPPYFNGETRNGPNNSAISRSSPITP